MGECVRIVCTYIKNALGSVDIRENAARIPHQKGSHGLSEVLREDQWERINDSLPGKAGDVGRTGDNRRVIEAVM